MPKHLVLQDGGYIIMDQTYFGCHTPWVRWLTPPPPAENKKFSRRTLTSYLSYTDYFPP